ncbi:MAG TPA: DUF5668 domain-containing protein [Candidatus Saccharimonadales bacterium]|nr:DUF5668 domain-containing protein [Candidatus Saccharimonadales bacterium]
MSRHDSGPFGHREWLYASSLGGVLIVTVGVIFLLQNFFDFDVMGKLWPVFIIIIGLGVLINQQRKKS